jgi:tRNA(Ile)-lysidine synthetase-like protein
MSVMDLPRRVEAFIRRHQLIERGAAVTCLVSGGADSTCLWHVLGRLGYDVSALHVNYGLRGEESEEDAVFCREVLGAEIVAPGNTLSLGTEAELRGFRYSLATDRLRATGHTASDQVETILYHAAARGTVEGMQAKREDGVVRPLLEAWREETEGYCRAEGLAYRTDTSNPDTKRGLIRAEVIPALERIHQGARENILRLARLETAPPEIAELLRSPAGSKRVDLGGGRTAVREYDSVWLERSPVALAGEVRWGPWRISAEEEGLIVRGWRAGDRLAGRTKKIQDVFVDAKIPRSEREAWPLVVRGNEVVAVPGLVDADGIRAERKE